MTMQRIFSVMVNKYCKDSFTELTNMPFVEFAALESMLRIKSMYDEEMEYNKYEIRNK